MTIRVNGRLQVKPTLCDKRNGERVSAILDNAVDSLEVGVSVWLKDDRETAPKHAILNIFHAIELVPSIYSSGG